MEIRWFIFLSLILFVTGVAGVITRKNVWVVLMSIELMLVSVNLLLVAFSKMHLTHANSFSGSVAINGQVFSLFITVVTSMEIVLGIAIALAFYRRTGSASINFLNRLKN